MSEEEITLNLIRGAIYSLPESDRKAVEDCAAKIRSTIKESGDPGLLALGLVGAEAAAAPD